MIVRVFLPVLLVGVLLTTSEVQAQSFLDKVRDFGMRMSHPELQQKRTKRNGKRSAETKRTTVTPAKTADQQIASVQQPPPDARAPLIAAATPLPPTPSPQTPVPAPTTAPANELAVRRATAERGVDPQRDVPYGVPVAGRPGFVTSPYAPRAGIVDVRGMPSGIEVKDPYTGKVFLTP